VWPLDLRDLASGGRVARDHRPGSSLSETLELDTELSRDNLQAVLQTKAQIPKPHS